MRIATWNVNSLKARQEAVEKWLERAEPDILLIQETKLTDADAPVMAFAMAGYQLVHHGEGRWNGVAIAARNGLAISDVVTNFGDGPVRDSGPGGAGGEAASEEDFDPFDEARMLAATVDGTADREPLRAERPDRRIAVLHRQARLVRAAGALDPRGCRYERAARPGRRPQRRPDRHGCLGCRRGPRRHARLRARAGRLPGAARPRAHRRVPLPAQRAGPLHVVGLPGRHVPQELRDADRPPARVARRWRHGSSTPRSTARRARARRSRPITRRWSSTSTNPASRSTPIGTAPWQGSRPGRSRRGRRIDEIARGRCRRRRAEHRSERTSGA